MMCLLGNIALTLGQLNNRSIIILPISIIGTYFLNLYFNMMDVVDFLPNYSQNPDRPNQLLTHPLSNWMGFLLKYLEIN